jgi:pilus assembly protein FimV
MLKRTIVAAAVAAAMLTPLAASAAGMGKITVLSALGEPLRAELDITATREEGLSLSARVAPVDAFRQANLEYAGVLSSLRFTLDKRPDGKPYFKIQTDRPVSDPFIDMLVELSWSSGRLVREYAFLLDPPNLKPNASNAPAPVNEVTPPVTPSAAEPAPPPVAVSRPAPETAAPAQKKKVEKAEPAAAKAPAGSDAATSANAADSHLVKSGDTLSKIAAENAVEGVTLNQMLVALFNSNRDAFSGANMNRLQAGKILTIPDASAVAAVSVTEARKVVVAQTAEFNAYRNSLGAAAEQQAPVPEQAAQSSAGKIAPKVEESKPADAGKDKLQVSRSADAGAAKSGKPSEEDRVARDKALKEANSRIADLEKNLGDLKQLAELKSQAAVDAQKNAQSAPPAAAPGGGISATGSLPVVPAPVPTTEAPISATPPTPASAPEQPPQKAKPPISNVALPPPSFIEENPGLVYGGGAAILALLGFLGFRSWKRKREVDNENEGVTLNEPATSALFGASGASESVDTSTGGLSGFSHSTLDAVDSGKTGVDPIQEAEVYMAYGRDIQAEEILRDALAKDPGHLAVALKLLEIYAARKSVTQFNEVAADLYQRTGGTGSEWSKAGELGKSIDPANSLYGGSGETDALSDQAAEIAREESPPLPLLTPEAESAKDELPEVIDFDLDLGSPSSTSTPDVPGTTSSGLDFDLDLDDDGTQSTAKNQASVNDLDIDLDAPAAAGNAIDFDLDDGDTVTPNPTPAAPPLDLSAISLDLGDSVPSTNSNVESSEVASKLELAQAYEEMGDREGARELLQEVIAEGSPAQQEAARNKLAQLD